jgi:hypothetical protein
LAPIEAETTVAEHEPALLPAIVLSRSHLCDGLQGTASSLATAECLKDTS